MSVNNIEIPVLVRTLSTHHWIAADTEMLQKKRKVQWAGTYDKWEYRITREKTTSKEAQRETIYKGNVVLKEKFILPKIARCKGKTKSGRCCKKRVYTYFCWKHLNNIYGLK